MGNDKKFDVNVLIGLIGKQISRSEGGFFDGVDRDIVDGLTAGYIQGILTTCRYACELGFAQASDVKTIDDYCVAHSSIWAEIARTEDEDGRD